MTDPTPTTPALRELIDAARVAVGALRELARLRAGDNRTPVDDVADRLVLACHAADDAAALLSADPMAGRVCPWHGPLVGVRYCPECASMGCPWTELQADMADEIARLKTRCPAVDATGARCERVQGHPSYHQSGDGKEWIGIRPDRRMVVATPTPNENAGEWKCGVTFYHPPEKHPIEQIGAGALTFIVDDVEVSFQEQTLRRGDEPSSWPMSVPPSNPESSSASKIPEGTAEATPAPPDERRQAYLERLERSTKVLTDRVSRAEQLTADDYALHINARPIEGGAPPPLPDPVWPTGEALPLHDRLNYAAKYIAQFDGCWLGHTDCLHLTAILAEAALELLKQAHGGSIPEALPLPVPSLSGETKTTTNDTDP